MAITTRVPRPVLWLVLLGLPLVSVPSYSEPTKDWNIQPSLNLGLGYTSNLDLTDDNEEESAVARVSPGVKISREGRYLSLGFDYQIGIYGYSSDQQNEEHFHRLNAFVESELVDERLFLDARATARQQLIDNRDSATSDPGRSPDSFTNTLALEVKPRWQQRLGRYSKVGIDASYDTVLFEREAEDSDGGSYSLFFDTEDSPAKLFWDLELRQQNSEQLDDNSTLSKEDRAELQLGYRHSRQLSFRIGGGYVDNHLDQTTDSDTDSGGFWSTGIDWTPTGRTSLNGYYSDSLQSSQGRGLVLSHRMRRTSWSLSYQQSLSNVRQQILQFAQIGALICPQGGSFDLSDCRPFIPGSSNSITPNEQLIGINALVPALSEGQFINDSVNGSVTYRYGKTTLSLSLYSERRRYQELSGDDERDIGFNSRWQLQLSGRSSCSLSYNWSSLEPDNNDPSGDKDYQQEIGANFDYQLSPKIKLGMTLGYNKRRADDPDRRFEEYSGGADLNVAF